MIGGRVGRAGAHPVVDLGKGGAHAPRTAGQGQIMGLLEDAAAARRAGGPSPLAPMPGAAGEGVASGMPLKWRVLKTGGRVLMVVGIASDAYEFFSADAAAKPRVAVGIAGGAAGGFAAGAAAGLVCGPGAPVCSIVLGIAGALGGRALFQALFDAFGDGNSPRCVSAYRGQPATAAGDCPNCHRIRRVQECEDEDPFTGWRARDLHPGLLGPLPGLDALPSATWRSREYEAFMGAAAAGGGGMTRTLSARDLAELDAFLGIKR